MVCYKSFFIISSTKKNVGSTPKPKPKTGPNQTQPNQAVGQTKEVAGARVLCFMVLCSHPTTKLGTPWGPT